MIWELLIISTRLLNNRIEPYNTKRSYWGEDEMQHITDGMNTDPDLPYALPLSKTITVITLKLKSKDSDGFDFLWHCQNKRILTNSQKIASTILQ